MLDLEDQCYMMGPLIDQQLQKIDYKHAVLEDLNLKVLEAFQMYNNLMKESISKTTAYTMPTPSVNHGQNAGNFIPFVAAPPQTDISLSNQLNNFVNFNNSIQPVQMQQQQAQQSDQFNANATMVANYQAFNNGMYQSYNIAPIDPNYLNPNLPVVPGVQINQINAPYQSQ
jgi:hypothetical protein